MLPCTGALHSFPFTEAVSNDLARPGPSPVSTCDQLSPRSLHTPKPRSARHRSASDDWVPLV